MYFLIQYLSQRSKKYFKKQQNAMGYLNGFIEEMVDGIQELFLKSLTMKKKTQLNLIIETKNFMIQQ